MDHVNDRPVSSARASFRADVLRVALIVFVYFLAQQIAFVFPDPDKILTVIWPASGVGLAGLLLSRRRLWPPILVALFVSGVVAETWAHRPLFLSMGFMTANVLESLACAWLISRGSGERVGFTRLHEVLALVAAAIFVNAGTAFLGGGIAGLADREALGHSWFEWWIADAFGILLVTPLIVTWGRLLGSLPGLRWGRVAECVAFMVLWCLVAWQAFNPRLLSASVHVEPYMLVGLLCWPALRFGQHWVALLLIVLEGIAITSQSVVSGPLLWGGASLQERQQMAQLFLGCITITGLLLAASRAEASEAKAKLRLSESFLQTVVEQSPHPLLVADGNGTLTRVNQACLDLLNVTRDEVVGKYNVFQDEVVQEKGLLPLVRRVFVTGETVRFDIDYDSSQLNHIKLSHFSKASVDVTVAPIRDAEGRTAWAVIQLVDVTERKRSEDTLKESEERLQLALEGANAGIWEWNVETNQDIWSVEVWRLFGLDPNTHAPCFESFRHSILPEDWGAVEAEIIAASDRGTEINVEWRVNDPGGPTRWLLSRGVPRKNEAGRVFAYRGIVIDITELKRLGNELRQAQKMESVGQLAGGVAHEFNNLLQIMLGYLEIVHKDLVADADTQEALDEVQKAAVRAAELTQQLLAFSRRQIIQPVRVDLNDLIQNLLKMVMRVTGEHIDVQFVPGESLDPVFVDKGQIEQILMNLYLNARDAMPGGGTLTIKTGNTAFDAKYCRNHAWAMEGRYAFVSLSDTGHGIEAGTLAHIFEPFFTTKGVGEGTGLGLATVYGIVKQHHGLIDVSSESGKGTVFSVFLPAVECAEENGELPKPLSAAGGTETILVAEDDASVLKIIETTLRTAGYTVLSAANGNEALRVHEEHGNAIDLVILDVVMPGMGGQEVMDRIRSKKNGVPFLFSSGYSQDALHTDFVIDAGLRLMQKPYRRERLLSEVRRILDARAAQERG